MCKSLGRGGGWGVTVGSRQNVGRSQLGGETEVRRGSQEEHFMPDFLNETPVSSGAPRRTGGVQRVLGRDMGEGRQPGRRPECRVSKSHGQQWKVLVGKGTL